MPQLNHIFLFHTLGCLLYELSLLYLHIFELKNKLKLLQSSHALLYCKTGHFWMSIFTLCWFWTFCLFLKFTQIEAFTHTYTQKKHILICFVLFCFVFLIFAVVFRNMKIAKIISFTEIGQALRCIVYSYWHIHVKEGKVHWKWGRTKLYSDCLQRESNFLASTRRVTALCVCVCCIACVCDCVMVIHMQAYVQIMQHTHTHKAVTGRVEAKKLLSRQRQSNYSPCPSSCQQHSSCVHEALGPEQAWFCLVFISIHLLWRESVNYRNDLLICEKRVPIKMQYISVAVIVHSVWAALYANIQAHFIYIHELTYQLC